ncbi:hypothetical protein QOZ80_1BG0092530 [Eleusine coracana subsp. coracana]|nr:hypothetical protein QOZ80_1BG0092530 [Eleusine coracana subsp. coracana]
MDSICSLSSSTLAAVFPSRGRLADARGHGAPGVGCNARPVCSTRRSSIPAAYLPRFTTKYHKRPGPMEAKLIKNKTEVTVSSNKNSSRKFRWTKERTNFLTRYMTQQASNAKLKGAMFSEDVLSKAADAVSQRFQRECGVADVQRRLTSLREKWRKIERMKSHGPASWNHATRTISMNGDDYQQYAMVHPMDSGLINRPIQGYCELAFMFGDEEYPGNTQAENDQNTHSVKEDSIGQKINNEDICYLVLKIGELIDTLKDLKPRDFADDLWKATACGYNERMAITAFEYFLKNEVEGKIFLVRSPELRKEWLAKFFSSFL